MIEGDNVVLLQAECLNAIDVLFHTFFSSVVVRLYTWSQIQFSKGGRLQNFIIE